MGSAIALLAAWAVTFWPGFRGLAWLGWGLWLVEVGCAAFWLVVLWSAPSRLDMVLPLGALVCFFAGLTVIAAILASARRLNVSCRDSFAASLGLAWLALHLPGVPGVLKTATSSEPGAIWTSYLVLMLAVPGLWLLAWQRSRKVLTPGAAARRT